ncbi:MAG TPA: M23 family metallopeptidase [Ktedonobacteraceae bacterium]|nr:M23 family metallopeptidase [Ktedonobacteraceae bacterium]
MFSSPEPRGTQPLTDSNSSPDTTAKLPAATSTAPLRSPHTSVKVPIVIPASSKRTRTDPLSFTAPHRRRIVLPGVLIGGMLVITLASLFVIPLGNSQHTSTIAQDIGGLFSSSQSNAIGTSQQAVSPTVTALSSGDSGGSCRGTDIWSTCATYITASGVQGTGQMQRPIQGAVISQVFGHNEYQLWCGCWKPHSGIDLAAPYGTPITAADTGQVIWVGWDWSGLGWAVKINHGNYLATIYGHMDHFIVKVGQNVTKGQIVGYEGSTGASTGPHVHFMVLLHNVWVDPQLYMQLP